MKEIVWVFGTSAAGKKTFIENILKDKSLAQRLGWGDKKIVACRESLNLLGHVGDKEIVDAREEILEAVPKLFNKADIVLIKWQYVDTHTSTPQRLKELLPLLRHRIILLKANPEEVKERLATKTWWKEFWSDTSFASREEEMVAKSLEQLSPSFEVITLNSSKDKSYQLY